MPEQNITTKFRVDISDLKKGITEANKQIKLANAQFKAASAGMDDWEKSTDGLRAKLDQLESVIAAQTSKLKNYQQQLERIEKAEKENASRAEQVRDAYQKAAEQYGKNSDEAKKLQKALSDIEKEQASNSKAADDLRIKILNQTAEVKKSEKQYSSFEKQLNEIENGAKDVGEAADDLGDSVKDSADAAKDASDGFTVMKGALADLVANGIRAGIDALKDMVTGVLDLSEATREYRSMQATLAGSADSFGYSVEFAKNQYKEFYSYLADDQMATNAITNLLGMQVSTDTVTASANAAIAVWSAYGDSIPIEALTESINETAQVGEVTGNLADALNWAGISEDDFNKKLEKCSSTQERADLIAQTLNDTYGKSKKTYDDLNGSILEVNEAQLELKDTQGEIGAIVEPVNAKLSELKNQVLEPLIPLIQQVSDEFLNWSESVDWAAVGEQVKQAVELAKEGFQWVIENKDEVIAGLEGILAGFIAFKTLTFLSSIIKVIVGIGSAISGASTAAAAFSGVLAVLGGPVTVVIAVLTALVSAFVYLWNTCEPFKQFWLDLWDNVKQIASDVAAALVEFFTVTIPEGINALIQWFQELPGNIKGFLSEVVSNVQEWAGSLVEKAVETGENFVDGVVSFFENLPYKVGYFIGQVLGNIISWNIDMIAKAKETGSKFLDAVVSFFKNLPGNVLNFITTTYKNVVTWGSNMGKKAIEIGKNFVNSVVNFIKNLPGNVLTWLTNTLNKVVSWGTSLWTAGTNAAKELFDAVVEGVAELPAKMLEVGSNIVSGVWNGISGAAEKFKENVSSFFSGIVDGVKNTLGIHSPSTVFAGIGSNMVAGLEQGWNKNINDAKEEIENDSKTLADVVEDTVSPVFDELSKKSSVAALEFDVWENAFSETATHAEVLQKQLESLTKQEEIQGETVQTAQWAYEKICTQYGDTSAEAVQYKETLLQEVKAYQELQTQIDSVNEELSGQKNNLDILRQSVTLTKTEYENWANSFGENTTKADQLSMELQSLKEQQEYQKQIVDAVTTEYNELCKQYGENSLEALEYKETLLEEIGTQQQLQIEIDDTSEALAQEQDQLYQLKKAVDEAISETDNFGNAISDLGSATSDLGELFGNELVSDVGSFISKIGGGINTILNFSSTVLGLVSAVNSLSTAFAGIGVAAGGAAAAGTAAAAGGTAAAAAGGAGILGTIATGIAGLFAPEIVIPLLLAGGAAAIVGGIAVSSSKKKTTTTQTTTTQTASGVSSEQMNSVVSHLTVIDSNLYNTGIIVNDIKTICNNIKASVTTFINNISGLLENISSGIQDMSKNLDDFRAAVSNAAASLSQSNTTTTTATAASSSRSGGTSVTFNQTINSPKALNRLEIYRQTKNQLAMVGG